MGFIKEQTTIVTNLARMIKQEFGYKISWQLAVKMAYSIAMKVEDKRIEGRM